MFNSQKVNNDPEPWVCPNLTHASRSAKPSGVTCCGMATGMGRPEFDNNPNPILEYLRDALETDLYEVREMARSWGDLIDAGYDWERDDGVIATFAHIDHARKVLERLAAL